MRLGGDREGIGREYGERRKRKWKGRLSPAACSLPTSICPMGDTGPALLTTATETDKAADDDDDEEEEERRAGSMAPCWRAARSSAHDRTAFVASNPAIAQWHWTCLSA